MNEVEREIYELEDVVKQAHFDFRTLQELREYVKGSRDCYGRKLGGRFPEIWGLVEYSRNDGYSERAWKDWGFNPEWVNYICELFNLDTERSDAYATGNFMSLKSLYYE